jgi:C_GCAxxG_C_C family probable redox protein
MTSPYIERSRILRERGYNCAQAVACTFADHLELDETTLFRLMEGFGGGMGGHQATCGALSGAVAVISLLSSGGSPEAGTKAGTYSLVRQAVERFERECKSLVCTEILGEGSGVPLCSCEACVEHGVLIVQALMGIGT